MTVFGRHKSNYQRTNGPEIAGVKRFVASKSTWKKFGITVSTAASLWPRTRVSC